MLEHTPKAEPEQESDLLVRRHALHAALQWCAASAGGCAISLACCYSGGPPFVIPQCLATDTTRCAALMRTPYTTITSNLTHLVTVCSARPLTRLWQPLQHTGTGSCALTSRTRQTCRCDAGTCDACTCRLSAASIAHSSCRIPAACACPQTASPNRLGIDS